MLYHVFVCLRVHIKVQLWLEEVQRGDHDEAHVGHHRRRDALQLVLDEKESRKEGANGLLLTDALGCTAIIFFNYSLP